MKIYEVIWEIPYSASITHACMNKYQSKLFSTKEKAEEFCDDLMKAFETVRFYQYDGKPTIKELEVH